MQTAVRLLILLTLAAAGCRKPAPAPPGSALHGRLTPEQYQSLSDREQIRYKDIVVRVPHTLGGIMPPSSPGAYSSILQRMVRTGDTFTLMGLYNQALFEIAHPRVRIEYINFDMWSDNFRSALAVALSAGRAPAYYVARDLPQTIEQGMYAEITDLMKRWDQLPLQPEMAVHEGTVDGRMYTMAKGEISALIIRYRKDWFREAGIFNEHGEPGPRSDWTWEEFRQIARKLANPAKNRFGFIGEMDGFLFNQAYGLDPLYIPDSSGRRTWRFNDQDPLLLESLRNSREMMNVDQSVSSTASLGWWEWHREFDAGHAAMVVSWAAHPPRESLEQPLKFGKEKPFAETVGMAPPPHGPTGLNGLKPICDLLGFDPTLNSEQLEAAFEWVKSWSYGKIFLNRLRQQTQDAEVRGLQSSLYADMLALPYQPVENPLDRPLEEVFPANYLRMFEQIKKSHYPPMPREFGLREPPDDAFRGAVRAMYSQAVTSDIDLKELVRRTADVINRNYLNFRGADDGPRIQRFIDARSDFYRRYFPRYYETVWRRKLETYYRPPAGPSRGAQAGSPRA